ncbi:PI-PLC X domain-containing protein 1-like [Uranotaenia lowii]|uniref:PI-PLC X domain-containing protein 1-like n=1 Tax=Uranotaenia lowii TaxID=190385 RepID=UPI002478C972|nr:PI-PLC X domain-containing protein 1-like [Uranotaenia lowii]
MAARAAAAFGCWSLLLAAVIIQLGQAQRTGDRTYEPAISDLYITVNARYQSLELTWRNFDDPDGYIVLTEDFPVDSFQQRTFYYSVETSPDAVGSTSPGSVSELDLEKEEDASGSGTDDSNRSVRQLEVDNVGVASSNLKTSTETRPTTTTTTAQPPTTQLVELDWEYDFRDEYGQRKKEVLFSIKPKYQNGWTRTDIIFDHSFMDQVAITTSCYGYYAYFINGNGTVQSSYCMKLYPTWMNDLKGHIGQFRVREMFIPGTHDSASFKKNFNHHKNDNIVTKYSLTQDDDIRNQLLQGVRYIDLRVGYYKTSNQEFWANHGISKMHPLKTILNQIKDYALETREIIIVDIQEFPVGFGKNYDIHDKLIRLLNESLHEVMADSLISWYGKLDDIWAHNKTVILAYDHEYAIRTYPDVVWRSAEQKWGNVQRMEDLKSYLFKIHKRHQSGTTNRPVADMAELTPDPWGVITDRYGGLRKMAESINRWVTKWYFEELGPTANIVAVDFIRGTSIIDAALYWNLKRVPNARDDGVRRLTVPYYKKK